MLALLLAGALGLQASPGGAAVEFENIRFQLPAGWTQARKDQDLFLQPGDLVAGQSFIVAIAHQSDPATAKLAEGLEDAWQVFAGEASTISDRSPSAQIKTTTGTLGLTSSGVVTTRGASIYTTVAVFKSEGRFRIIASLTNSRAAAKTYGLVFDRLLEGLEFREGAPTGSSAGSDPASGAATQAGPTGAPDGPPPKYELLLTFASGLSASPTGGSDYGGGTYVYCVFAEGSWLSTAPNRGLGGFDLAAEQRTRSDDFGTWQRNGGVLTLRTKYRFETLYPQADGNYLRRDKEAREGTYYRVPPSTGLRFAGRYIKDGQSDGPSTVSITFRADGTFEDRGVVAMILPAEVGVSYHRIDEVIGPGSGTYEIADNTMVLSYSDRRRKPMLFILTPKLAAKKTPDAIYLGKVWFKKSP